MGHKTGGSRNFTTNRKQDAVEETYVLVGFLDLHDINQNARRWALRSESGWKSKGRKHESSSSAVYEFELKPFNLSGNIIRDFLGYTYTY